MKTEEETMYEYDDLTDRHHEAQRVEPMQPVRPAMPYSHEGKLYLEEGADLPLEICACCGKKSTKAVRKCLRSPFKPATWYGKTRLVRFGVCRGHADSVNVGAALTFSFLSVGILVVIAGAVTLSISAIVFGALAAGLSGAFRARMPIYSPNLKEEPLEVRGNSPRLLEFVQEVEFEE